jgi:hypothetical protein
MKSVFATVALNAGIAGVAAFAAVGESSAVSLMEVDYPRLVARADLDYDAPATRPEEGMPVGNGRMGSLVWTEPTKLRFQINRVDVFAAGCDTRSFPRFSTDYASGCGYADLNLADFGGAVFDKPGFRQHLSVYDGLMTAQGNGVTTRVMTCPERDVMAVEIDDRRSEPAVVSLDLRMLRYGTQYQAKLNWKLSSQHASQIETGRHTATSRLDIRDGRIVLTQEFREGAFYNASAVAASVVGRTSQARYENESAVRLSAAPGQGKFVVLIGSAASSDPKQDVAAMALKEVAAAEAKTFEELHTEGLAWWRDYWGKAFVRLHSDDGEADFVERNYTYFLYVMASSSRGAYMPRFGGMLWYCNGDMREWGSQYWLFNQGCYYNGLAAANRPEIVKPLFSTYSRHFDSYARAARQQWGSQGVWIPETGWFDGLEDLPDDIAAEMRDLYLVRKPWAERSEKFRRFCENKSPTNSRWNWSYGGRWDNNGSWVQGEAGTGPKGVGRGPFAWVTHFLSDSAVVAYQYWLHYEHTSDREWLRRVGYPMIRGVAEFYRNFPNVKKGDDGVYHIRYVNNSESAFGTDDTPEEVCAMRAIVGMAMRAARALDEDAALVPVWREFYDHLPPLPRGPDWKFDLITDGAENRELFRQTQEAFGKRTVNSDTRINALSADAIVAANLGLTNHVRYLIPGQMRGTKENCDPAGVGESGLGTLRNRMGLREGPGCVECQRLGNASRALQTALLQDAPPAPDKEPVIRVFAAWPRQWDAQFTLSARGGFLVGASMEKGVIEFVELQSLAGGVCRLRNPWPGRPADLYRNGKKAASLNSDVFEVDTARGETVVVLPPSSQLKHKKVF